MLVKCNCNTCSRHLEFDAASAGLVIACPSCGMNTKLYIPPPPDPAKMAQQTQTSKSTAPVPVPVVIAVPDPAANSISANTLKEIRVATCYRTLRSLINAIQLLFFIAAGLIALGSIMTTGAALFGSGGMVGRWNIGAGTAIFQMVVGLFVAAFVAIIGLAWKQAALLLVDIADCQIQAASRKN